MQRLNSIYKCWPVAFLENVGSDLDHVVRTDADEVAVKGSVMQLAESQPVRNNRFSSQLSVRHDVSRVEEFLMSEPAKRAGVPVGRQNAFPKGSLV